MEISGCQSRQWPKAASLHRQAGSRHVPLTFMDFSGTTPPPLAGVAPQPSPPLPVPSTAVKSPAERLPSRPKRWMERSTGPWHALQHSLRVTSRLQRSGGGGESEGGRDIVWSLAAAT